MKLTVATWNMDHWKRTPDQRRLAWEHLRDSGVDVALLQETVPLPGFSRDSIVWREIGDWRRFGSAVVCFRDWPIEELTTARSYNAPLRAMNLLQTYPGSIAIARVHPPDVRPIVFVSLYSVLDPDARVTLIRQAADLVPLFDSTDGDRIVLGGDLNVSTQSVGDDVLRSEAALGVVRSLGLVDLVAEVTDRPAPIGEICGCGLGPTCPHVATFPNEDGGGSHLDYIFASKVLSSGCSRVRLDDAPGTRELSDHWPVIATFEVQPTQGPLPWSDRDVDDISDAIRAVFREPRTWRIWTPAGRGPRLTTDRPRTCWISAVWEGTLADDRPAKLELGLWRDEAATGHPLVGYAGWLGTYSEPTISGLTLRPTGLITVTYDGVDYVVVPITPERSQEDAVRIALDTLIDASDMTSAS